MNPLVRQAVVNVARYKAACEAAGSNPVNWCRCRALLNQSMREQLLEHPEYLEDSRPFEMICHKCAKPQHPPIRIHFVRTEPDWYYKEGA